MRVWAAAVWPLAARAQEAGQHYRIAIIEPPRWKSFLDELGQAGFVEGRNREIDSRGMGVATASYETIAADQTAANKMRRFGFNPIRYRRLPFWAWGLTWNFIQHLVLWKYRLKMRTFVELERIIWRPSKVFVFGNPYNTVLATKPAAASCSRQTLAPSEALGGVAETDR
ncbi:hypothetical protein ACFIOY_39060 [Bradyrhizobium sp. TZ2]